MSRLINLAAQQSFHQILLFSMHYACELSFMGFLLFQCITWLMRVFTIIIILFRQICCKLLSRLSSARVHS
ncbi:hypothetical protein PUN28_020176 [Cardiocondyla obscurior]|uniref:ATP synthase F0 subunit 8 n=1 Tax=Cardiocondyla obscurior TaxID=286306 RepID=A0AAW2E7R0_9HYME